MSEQDIVDNGHQDRDCPYCGRRQRWVSDPEGKFESHYFHLDDLNQYCDAERLDHWDMGESLRRTSGTFETTRAAAPRPPRFLDAVEWACGDLGPGEGEVTIRWGLPLEHPADLT